MARRGSRGRGGRNSGNDDATGCLVLILGAFVAAIVGAFALLRSKNPEERAIGWAILIIVAIIIIVAMISGN